MSTSHLTPIEWSDETLDEAINGVFTVTRMGQNVPYTLTAQEKQAFEQAKLQGYILFPKRDNLRNVFSQWCEIHEQPYVYAERRGRYASVKMDLIFCDQHKGYEKDPLFEEKLLIIISIVGNLKTALAAGGTYNYVSGIHPDHAVFVARSFLAIYKQHLGEDIKAPAFPPGWQDAPVIAALEEAKKQHYAYCTIGRKWLDWQWRQFCLAHGWPRIELSEDRKGSAKVSVDLFPALKSFTPEMDKQLAELGLKCGIKDSSERRGLKEHFFILDNQSLYMLHAAPIEQACELATGIAKILDGAGYFLPVDEFWHE